MIEFLQEYWHVLIRIVLLLIVILVTIFKKKGSTYIEGIFEYIYKHAPRIINEVEAMANGSKYIEYEGKVTLKIDVAISMMLKELAVFFPANDVNLFSLFIRNVIEDILSTPKKKEVLNGKR